MDISGKKKRVPRARDDATPVRAFGRFAYESKFAQRDHFRP